MKIRTLRSLPLLIAMAVATSTQITFAQTWQTVDDYQVVSNHVTQPYAITVDAHGTIYVAGMSEGLFVPGPGAYVNAIVRRSTDQGATWTTIEEYSYPNPPNPLSPSVRFISIGLDLAQNLYAVGLTGLGGVDSTDRLIVRKSADGGETWATALDVAAPDAPMGTATLGSPGFAADAAGAIYVSVKYGGGSFILKSTDAGATWISSIHTGWVRGMVLTSAGLFSAEAPGNPWGMVKKSLNGGATWTTVDSYTPAGFNGTGGTGNLSALCADWSGNLYVGGFAGITVTTGHGKNAVSTTTYNWVIRKGINGGATWSTQAIIPTGGTDTSGFLNGIEADPAGNVYAVGRMYDSLGHQHWSVQKSVNQGASWTLVDSYGPYAPLFAAYATGVASDAAGNVYVCGTALLPGGTSGHWVVRKQVGP
jgi:hypothetical protein